MKKFVPLVFAFLVSSQGFAVEVETKQPSEGKPVINPPSMNEKTETPSGRLVHDFDSGLVYKNGDFKWVNWGFAERLYNPKGEPSWKRVRQGMQFDLPRYNESLRSSFVYEVDFTDNDFGKQDNKWKVFENLYVTLQNADDPGKFRTLIGENTHIISREDNLSSGNLPTISRSLILEEHGSVNNFGTQFGIQAQKALNSKFNLAASAQDNRGSLNSDDPKYEIGRSIALKLSATEVQENSTKKFTYGLGVDHTKDIGNKTFTLATGIGGEALGSTAASGDKLTFEGDVAFVDDFLDHKYSFELEALTSKFSGSGSSATGGYVLGQVNVFDNSVFGGLDPFLRYDLVRLSHESVPDVAVQDALRIGLNYNVPKLMNLVNLHFEYVHNRVGGPLAIVPEARTIDEARIEIRFSMTRYARY